MSYQLFVAATRNDWVALFQATKGNDLLGIYHSGLLSEPPELPYEVDTIPDLGQVKYGSMVAEASYLVLPTELPLYVETVKQNSGGVKYDVSQIGNLDSFVFRAGGPFNDCFVVGEISSLYKVGIAANFGQRLIGRVRRHYFQSDHFWVGPECYTLYKDTHYFTEDCRGIEYGLVKRRGL